MTDYYDPTGAPATSSFGDSATIRAEFAAIQSGISNRLPPLSGNGGEHVRINSGATGMESITTAALLALLVTAGAATVTSVGMSVPTGLSVAGSPITTSGTLAVTYTAGYAIPTTAKQTEWDTAYSERRQWDGGATNLAAATGRTSLGGTTVGQAFFTLVNPSAVTFPRMNADNSVSALSASDYRTALGLGSLATLSAVNDSNWSGTDLSVANGGTGASTLTANNVILGNGTSAVQFVAPGTSGNVLTSNGTTWTSAAPTSALLGTTDAISPFETSLGSGAGGSSTGVNNTFIGYEAGNDNTTGTDNTAVGFQALDANTVGDNNTAIGRAALGSNTTGYYNTAVGAVALFANTTGIQNTAVGRASLNANTIGVRNTGVGYTTLQANTTGTDNTAIGNETLDNNTTGSFNIAIGSRALGDNVNGSANVAIGYAALLVVDGVDDTVAVGYRALTSLTSGAQNTAVGSLALRDATTGARNMAVGYAALLVNTIGSDCAAIGVNALVSNTTGIQNTAIGSGTGSSITTGSNLTCIGYDAEPTSATATNQVTIGNDSVTLNRFAGEVKAARATAIPSGGSQAVGFTFTTTANFGLFAGSGAPTLSAAQGSAYLRSDGAAATTVYVNTDGATTWAAAGASGNLIYIKTVTVSGAASADIEDTMATYRRYVIKASNVKVSGSDVIRAKLKIGGSYAAANYSYHYDKSSSGASTYDATASGSNSYIPFTVSQGTAAEDSAEFDIEIYNPANTAVNKKIYVCGSSNSGSAVSRINASGQNYGSTAALTGVRVEPGTGNISGTFDLYAYKDS